MRINLLLTRYLILGMIFALLLPGRVASQPATHDLNKQHDPMIIQPGFVPPSNKAPLTTVVTINGYDNFRLGTDFAECSITCNPLNPVQMYAVWNSAGNAGGNGYRTDNGFDWQTSNPTWSNMYGDVVLATDSLGNLFYENMFGGSTIQGCKVARSGNYGLSWDPVVQAISGVDKNWIVADMTGGTYSNYIYTTMTASSQGNHARSIDHGNSFLNTWGFMTQSLPGMMPATGPTMGAPGTSVYVVTHSGSSFSSIYTFYESRDGGVNFEYKSQQGFTNYVGTNVSGRNSVQNMRTRPYPFLVADNSFGPHRGRLYLIYASNNPVGNGNKPDIYCRYSDDGGAIWSEAVTVNDDANSTANHNWFPAIWCDKLKGRLYVSWMDTRDTPTSDSALIYASYTDDGITFAPNQAVSNKKMKINCTACGGGGSPMYLGDYNGVVSNGKVSVMAWTDFRDNNFGSYVAYFPDFAVTVSPAIDTLYPTATYQIEIPSVKLYADTVIVSVDAGALPIQASFPQGNKLSAFPGSIPVVLAATSAINPGDYPLTFITTGPNGTPIHKRTATLRVLAPTTPVANFSASPLTSCVGQTVTFHDLSTGPPTSWHWTFAGGNPSSSTEQNPVVTYPSTGNYDVSLTVTNGLGSNSITKSGYIQILPEVTPPTAESAACCFGAPVPELTATGSNIKWYYNGTEVGQGPSLNTGQSEPGVYTYSVTSSNAVCESSAVQVSLTIHPKPIVILSGIEGLCLNSEPIVPTWGNPSGGVYSGLGFSANTFNPALAGVGKHAVSYQYNDNFGCGNTATDSVEVKPLPAVSVLPVEPICQSSPPVALSGSPSGGIFFINGLSTDSLRPALMGAGNYQLVYHYFEVATGCANADTTTVTILPEPHANLADASACGNRSIRLDATVPGGTNYVWTPGPSTTAVLMVDTTHRGLGNFVFTVKITDNSGCIGVDTIHVSFFDCTGIAELSDENGIKLLPNPSNGFFRFQASKLPVGVYQLTVSDASGKIIWKSEAHTNEEGNIVRDIQLTKPAAGVYLLRLQGKEVELVKKLVIFKP